MAGPMEQDPPVVDDAGEGEIQSLIDGFRRGHAAFYRFLHPSQSNVPDPTSEIAVLGPLLFLLSRMRAETASSSGQNNQEEQERRLTRDYEPRDPITVNESRVMRTVLKAKWNDQATPSEMDVSWKRLYHEYTQRGLRKKKMNYVLANLLADANKGDPVRFTNGQSLENMIWNTGMSAFVLKKYLISAINEEITDRQRNFDDANQVGWVLDMMTKICKHVTYRTKTESASLQHMVARNKKAKQDSHRNREFGRRIDIVRNTPGLKHTEEALRLLGHDGMSSDEEDADKSPNNRVIHKHPWRSLEATKMIRYISAVVDAEARLKKRSGNSKNERYVLAGEWNSRRSMQEHLQIPSGLPENFYNWQVIEGQAEFSDFDLRAALRVRRARPELLVVPDR